MKLKLIIITLFISLVHPFSAQSTRQKHYNTIGWYNYFGTIKISEKFGIHTEYQWRRENIITNWQQSLLRIGINYQLSQGVLLRLGYGWIETFHYGDFAINGLGRDFTEHRIFQMVQLNHNEGRVDFFHRFMNEQRFIGRYSSAFVAVEDEYPLLNRIRYMMRLQIPLNKKEPSGRLPYLALYNEVFIGYGKNVGLNVFDQNRFAALFGYRFSKALRIEGGYLSQVLQFARQINGKNAFQYNSGIILNVYLNLSLAKKNS